MKCKARAGIRRSVQLVRVSATVLHGSTFTGVIESDLLQVAEVVAGSPACSAGVAHDRSAAVAPAKLARSESSEFWI
jgi:hypothetical protein